MSRGVEILVCVGYLGVWDIHSLPLLGAIHVYKHVVIGDSYSQGMKGHPFCAEHIATCLPCSRATCYPTHSTYMYVYTHNTINVLAITPTVTQTLRRWYAAPKSLSNLTVYSGCGN